MTVTTDICARCGHGKRFHRFPKVGTGLGSCGGAVNMLSANCPCLGYEEPATITADDVPQERSTFEVSCELLEWVEGLEKGLITPAGQREIAAIIKPQPMPLRDRLIVRLGNAYADDLNLEQMADGVVEVVTQYLDQNAQPGAAAMIRRSM